MVWIGEHSYSSMLRKPALTQHCKSANMLLQKYVDLRRSCVLFKPKWPLMKFPWHQCKSSVCRVFGITSGTTVLFPTSDCLYRMSSSLRKYWPSCRKIFSGLSGFGWVGACHHGSKRYASPLLKGSYCILYLKWL